MANTKSSEKRARQSKHRELRNKNIRSKIRTVTKQAQSGIKNAKTRAEALPFLASAEKALQKAASKGVIPKKRASRKVSRLAHTLPTQ
mgnify:CR=1 FL=1